MSADEVMTRRNGVCFWCGTRFTPRRDGGKAQVFCRPACRRGFDAAGRQWVAEAIATGVLTVDALKNGLVSTRALGPATTSPLPVGEVPPQRFEPVASRADSPYAPQQKLERLMAQAIAIRRRG
jgi:hypothetical protein